MDSRVGAKEARRVFDAIVPVSFSEYDAAVRHEYAHAHLYRE
jgi:hypothetical protein